METLSALIPCLLLALAATATATATDQDPDAPPPSDSRPLPQWLTGIIAVCGFLFLGFVVLLVKKAWCEDSQRKKNNDVERLNIYETSLDSIRRKDSLESEKRSTYKEDIHDDDKATAM